MPKWLHDQLVQSAKKAGLRPGSKRFDAYIYSVLQKYKKRKAAKVARARR